MGVVATGYLYGFDSLALQHRQQVEQSLVLLHNANNLLPVRHLDTIRVKGVFFGSEQKEDAFHQRINAYKEQEATVEEANLIVVGLDLFQHIDFQDVEQELGKLGNVRLVLIVNGNEGFSRVREVVRGVSALVYAPVSDMLSFDLAVQGIFGGIGFQGKIDMPEDPPFAGDVGILTEPIQRFSYTIPEAFGVSFAALDSGISAIAQQGLDSMAYPGCQVLVAKEGAVIYHKAFGYHTYAKQRQVRLDDVYDLASVSKVTGATTALMKLYDDGLLELDKKLSDYWADFKGTDKENMTVREVLAHQARLKPYISYYQVSKRKNGRFKWGSVKTDSSMRFPYRISSTQFLHKDYKEKKIYRMIKKSTLNEKPGYVYSGLSFYLYPQIVQDLTGQAYDHYLEDRFFTPLGAGTLTFNPLEKLPLERIVPTENDNYFRMEQLHGIVHDEGAAMMLGVSGNAGLFSKAIDLAKVWQMYLNGGMYGGKRYLSEEVLEEFTRCQYCEEGNRRGLGFDKPLVEYDRSKSSVSEAASPASYGHSGYTGTIVWADPENDLLYIFLSNRVYPTRENRKLYQMSIRPRIHEVVYSLLP